MHAMHVSYMYVGKLQPKLQNSIESFCLHINRQILKGAFGDSKKKSATWPPFLAETIIWSQFLVCDDILDKFCVIYWIFRSVVDYRIFWILRLFWIYPNYRNGYFGHWDIFIFLEIFLLGLGIIIGLRGTLRQANEILSDIQL